MLKKAISHLKWRDDYFHDENVWGGFVKIANSSGFMTSLIPAMISTFLSAPKAYGGE